MTSGTVAIAAYEVAIGDLIVGSESGIVSWRVMGIEYRNKRFRFAVLSVPGSITARKTFQRSASVRIVIPESPIHSARIVVRKIGQAAEHVYNHGAHIGLYYNIMHAYDMACAHLTQLDPAGAPEFIKSTYGPAFRQTGASK